MTKTQGIPRTRREIVQVVDGNVQSSCCKLFVFVDIRLLKTERGSQLVVNDDSENVVARYHKPHTGVAGKARKPRLEILPAGGHMVDLVVITFLYINTLRRKRQRGAKVLG